MGTSSSGPFKERRGLADRRCQPQVVSGVLNYRFKYCVCGPYEYCLEYGIQILRSGILGYESIAYSARYIAIYHI